LKILSRKYFSLQAFE